MTLNSPNETSWRVESDAEFRADLAKLKSARSQGRQPTEQALPPRQGRELQFAKRLSEDLRVNSTPKAKPGGETPADFDAIIEDLAALRRDFSALMGQMKSGAFKGANDAADNTVGQFGDMADHLYESVAAQGKRSATAIGRQFEERPVLSLLIAFGVGFIASRLLIR